MDGRKPPICELLRRVLTSVTLGRMVLRQGKMAWSCQHDSAPWSLLVMMMMTTTMRMRMVWIIQC